MLRLCCVWFILATLVSCQGTAKNEQPNTPNKAVPKNIQTNVGNTQNGQTQNQAILPNTTPDRIERLALAIAQSKVFENMNKIAKTKGIQSEARSSPGGVPIGGMAKNRNNFKAVTRSTNKQQLTDGLAVAPGGVPIGGAGNVKQTFNSESVIATVDNIVQSGQSTNNIAAPATTKLSQNMDPFEFELKGATREAVVKFAKKLNNQLKDRTNGTKSRLHRLNRLKTKAWKQHKVTKIDPNLSTNVTAIVEMTNGTDGNSTTCVSGFNCPPPWIGIVSKFRGFQSEADPLCQFTDLFTPCTTVGETCKTDPVTFTCCPRACLSTLSNCNPDKTVENFCIPVTLQPWIRKMIKYFFS